MRRIPLIIVAVPAGLAAGLLAWFAAGGVSANVGRLDPVATQISALRSPRVAAAALVSVNAAELAAAPLFALTTGPAAVPQPTLRLDGLVRSRTRTAALLSVNGKPAEWLSVGEARDGVSLQAVLATRVVVDTLFGPQEVTLGDQPSPAAPAPTADLQQTVPDAIPPGFRAPPPPASAPERR